jgi:hypothetical protein
MARKVLAVFCAGSVVFLAARDLLVPEVRDVEVWLGFEVRGAAALATAPLHWAIFAAGAWAFWSGKPWIWHAAAGYAFVIALSHLVWSEASPHGNGWRIGLLQAAGFALVAFGLLRLRRL